MILAHSPPNTVDRTINSFTPLTRTPPAMHSDTRLSGESAEMPDGSTLGAAPGYCAAVWEVGDCANGNKGSWSLRAAEVHSNASAAAQCELLCAGCSRCRFISFSTQWRDCSWFHNCDLAKLKRDVLGFLSVRSGSRRVHASSPTQGCPRTVKRRVPPILHQSWNNRSLPRVLAAISARWAEVLPGWTRRMWTADDNRQLWAQHFPQLLHIYDGFEVSSPCLDRLDHHPNPIGMCTGIGRAASGPHGSYQGHCRSPCTRHLCRSPSPTFAASLVHLCHPPSSTFAALPRPPSPPSRVHFCHPPSSQRYIERADATRLLYLFLHGGVYADLDVAPCSTFLRAVYLLYLLHFTHYEYICS